MSDRIRVATRKGLFTVERGAGGWSVASTAFLGDPVTAVLDDARDGALYAALNLGHFGVKLRRSDDGGATWVEVAAPAFLDNRAPASVKQVWVLERAAGEGTGALWAGTLPGGLFRSYDRGETWTLNDALWDRPERSAWLGGGYDDPGIHSILVDPRDPARVLVGVSCGGVWESEDDGGSWILRGQGMRAEYMPPERRDDPRIQDPHRLACCVADPDIVWAQHHNGVFRSEDGGRTWEAVTTVEPSAFGFAVAVHPRDPKTVWTIPAVKDECRIPVGGRVVVARTRDAGLSFEVLRRGLPQEHAYDLVFRHALDVDATGDRLAFGSTTGSLWVSEDGGDRWEEVSAHLPPVYAVRFAG